MCLAALGSQTVGSLIRPASFCGVCAWKPGLDSAYQGNPKWSSLGIMPLAEPFDMPGVMTRTVADLAIVDRVVNPRVLESQLEDDPLTFALLKGPFEERAEPAMREAMGRAVAAWREAGIEITEVDELPDWFAPIWTAGRTTLAAHAAAFHFDRFRADPGDYPPRITELIREGLATSAVEYLKAQSLLGEAGLAARASEWTGADLWITPSTLGAAPGPETTGDAVFNGPWTFLGLAAATLPIGLSPDGLPLGAQVIAPANSAEMFPAIERLQAVVSSKLLAQQR
jgi:aspartyl-tRNA(Asn)/glutamyl-tRNA(Gln) amidotransferase subunit A